MSQIGGVLIILLIFVVVMLGIEARVVHKGGVLENKKAGFFKRYIANKFTLGILFLVGLLFQDRGWLFWGLLGIILLAYLIEGYWYIFTGRVRLWVRWLHEIEPSDSEEIYPKITDEDDTL